MPRLTLSHPISIISSFIRRSTRRFPYYWSLIIAHGLLFFAPLLAQAQVGGEILKNLDATGGAAELGNTTKVPLPTLIGSIIRTGLIILGTVFLALIVYAGFVWLLARGREEEVQRAQKIIESSVIGLIVVILAYAISRFIFTVVVGGAGV